MANSVTIKDALYAMEYLGERLCRKPSDKAGGSPAWHLSISGRKVPESVANSIRTSGKVSGVPGDHYGAMDYVWKVTA